jgi:hypothetical protein
LTALPVCARAQLLAYNIDALRLKQPMEDLDPRKAKATLEEDRTRILGEIEADLG